MNRRHWMAAVLAGTTAPMQGFAQQPGPFPAKPVHALIGFAAGGNTDVVARAIAKRLGELLGQPVVIENRLGAGGTLASDAVASAAPDGNTLLVSNLSSHILAPALMARQRADAQKASLPIALTNRTPISMTRMPFWLSATNMRPSRAIFMPLGSPSYSTKTSISPPGARRRMRPPGTSVKKRVPSRATAGPSR
jgi:hypothetical protein